MRKLLFIFLLVGFSAYGATGSPVNVVTFGADPTGATDSTAAFSSACSSEGASYLEVDVPLGVYDLTAAPTCSGIPTWVVRAGATFTGAGVLSSGRIVDYETSTTSAALYENLFPQFFGIEKIIAMGTQNGLVGVNYNNLPANSTAYPTGTSGYGLSLNAGNQTFGLFGRADLYAAGVATNEVDAFNYAGTPSGVLPPARGIGTTQIVPVALTVASGGSYPDAIGIQIAREGSTNQQMQTGIYINPDAILTTGLEIDATTTSTQTLDELLKHKAGGQLVQWEGVGTVVPTSRWASYVNGAGTYTLWFTEEGDANFAGTLTVPTITTTTLTSIGTYTANGPINATAGITTSGLTSTGGVLTDNVTLTGITNNGTGRLLYSNVAPTILSGFGSGAYISGNNGTAAFTVNIGTGGTASSGVIGMSYDTNGWACSVVLGGAVQPNAVAEVSQNNATSINLTNYSTSTGGTIAFPSGYSYVFQCTGL